MRYPEDNLNLKSLSRPEAFMTDTSRKVRFAALDELMKHSGKLLDIGCGNGLMLVEQQKFGKNFIVFGIDFDVNALQEAQQIAADNSLKKLSLVKGNGLQLPFNHEAFDSLICLNTFMNIEDQAVRTGLIDEMHRVCKQHGKIILEFRNRSNLLLKLKYFISRTLKHFSPVAYTKRQIKSLVSHLKPDVLTFIPIYSFIPFIPISYLVILEK